MASLSQNVPVRLITAVLVVLLPSQGLEKGMAHSVATAAAAETRGRFEDVTQKLGIHFRQQASPTSRKYLLETMGSGVALFDYDNDGRLDIFLGNGAEIDDPMPAGTVPRKTSPKYWNRLFHQKP